MHALLKIPYAAIVARSSRTPRNISNIKTADVLRYCRVYSAFPSAESHYNNLKNAFWSHILKIKGCIYSNSVHFFCIWPWMVSKTFSIVRLRSSKCPRDTVVFWGLLTYLEPVNEWIYTSELSVVKKIDIPHGVPSKYLNRCWIVANWARKNKVHNKKFK